MIALPVLLPDGFSPVIKVNDSVTVGQTIAQNTAKEEEIINIAKELSIPLAKVKKVLLKNPGDTVKIGDTIALKKSFFGFDQETIISRVEGTVTRYERHTGNLAIRTSYSSLTEKLVSPVDGVIALCDNEKIVIQTDKNIVTGKQGSGESGEGEVFILEASFANGDNANLLYHLDSQAIGKIVVANRLTREMLVKGMGLGVKGLISTQIATNDIEYLSQKAQKIPVIEIEEPAVDKLRKWKGKKVFMDGKSQAIIFLQA